MLQKILQKIISVFTYEKTLSFKNYKNIILVFSNKEQLYDNFTHFLAFVIISSSIYNEKLTNVLITGWNTESF